MAGSARAARGGGERGRGPPPQCGGSVRAHRVLLGGTGAGPAGSDAAGPGCPVELILEARGELAFVHVRDHGIGIAEADQQRIFGRFERAVSVSHYGGLGLGLYIARQLVEAQDGTLEVQSSPGGGATFTVSLRRSAGSNSVAGPGP